MFDPYTRLEARVGELGNHHRKYLKNISAHKDTLIDRLEACGKIDQVHFRLTAPDLASEMDTVMAVGRNVEEKLTFLGCYYALQFLNMNISAIDVLALNLATSDDRYTVYKGFMRQIGNEFRALTACHMDKLLNLFLDKNGTPEYVICGVGTRADQDDIDVGIIDDGSRKRKDLNLAVGRLQHSMLKQSVPLHLYLSEHVGTQSYSASIAEYNDLLKKEIQDFVIITEMLGAAPITGSNHLFRKFRREVTQRYYYQRQGDNRFHEGYLRGLLGEVRSLLIRRMKTNSINPKDDGLRMLKGLLFAGKSIFNIRKVNAWDILKQLGERDPDHTEIFQTLDRSLTFLEMFRFLYQLFVVQEDEIYVGGEDTISNLQSVAKAMGYQDVGVIKAWDHLLIHYYEHIDGIKDPIEILLKDVIRHLERISVFSVMLSTRQLETQYEGNLVIDFLKASRFFRGTKFWDDVLGALETGDGQLLERFVTDFNSLDTERRIKWIAQYADWSNYAFMVLMRLLVILYQNRKKVASEKLFNELNEASLEALSQSHDVIHRITRIFNHYPKLVNNYLLALSEEDQLRFKKLLEGNVWEEEVAQLRDHLVNLCQLHCCSNRYFKRFFQRIINAYPEYIQYLDNTDRLKELAKGLFGKIDNLKTFREKKDQLGHYHDIEFFRVGLETLAGAPIEQTNAEFTEFSDNYLQTLFDICKQEVEQEREGKLKTEDLLAVFAAGGHAREQAFDDDYDIIVLLNSSDEALRKKCTTIISKMNTELVKRGTLPHFRFAERYGHYVTLFSELEELFESNKEDSFIDKSQILGARMVVGSRRFGKAFEQLIIQPHIYNKKDTYIQQMAQEIFARHVNENGVKEDGFNIKENSGGLRDIEMVMLMYKAALHIQTPVSMKLFDELSDKIPDKGSELKRLSGIFSFLKRLRDIYRLTVAAEDTIYLQNLDRVSPIMNFKDSSTQSASQQLMMAYRENMKQGWSLVSEFISDIGHHPAREIRDTAIQENTP
ncbi:MAG: hypothetical protein JSV84_11315 [Gemmatimonadota bacterium]|nr:MAG: hypothetical protein JSV84_11315 [Gemmatimonadota bacterium]